MRDTVDGRVGGVDTTTPMKHVESVQDCFSFICIDVSAFA